MENRPRATLSTADCPKKRILDRSRNTCISKVILIEHIWKQNILIIRKKEKMYYYKMFQDSSFSICKFVNQFGEDLLLVRTR